MRLARGGATVSSRLARADLWCDGVVWLLLGISMFCLLNALVPDRSEDEEGGARES